MKLSEVRPCDKCSGPVGQTFNVVRSSLAFVSANAANGVLGTMQILGGWKALKIAEALAPNPDAIKIAGEENPVLWTDAILCMACWAESFGEVFERRNAVK